MTTVAGPTLTDVQTDDADVFMIGLCESPDPEAWSLTLMASDEDLDDEQDIELGMDAYRLVVEPGQATVYGGVLQCELSDEVLVAGLVDALVDLLATATGRHRGQRPRPAVGHDVSAPVGYRPSGLDPAASSPRPHVGAIR